METTSATDPPPKSVDGAGAQESELPLRPIPGGYGIPFVSQLVNRWRYLYLEGEPAYWETRLAKYKSTVFRTNMPPGWPWTDSRCIMLLDQKSFPTVFDYDKVDKYKAFTGTYMSSTSYNGGHTVCSYLDASDKKHEQLKSYCFELLKLASSKWVPEFHRCISSTFIQWEYKMKKTNSAKVSPYLAEAMFRFVINAFTCTNLDDLKVADSEKPVCADLQKWAGFQIIPVSNLGLPFFIEELLHIVPIPAFLAKGGYNKMVHFLEHYADDTLALAQKYGVSKDEAVHNLIFFMAFNAHGGFLILFPLLLTEVGADDELQAELRKEVRAAVKASGSDQVTMNAVTNDMPLVASTVYETLRHHPPVPFQYGRAKKDFVLESHDARFEVKKGEFLGGVNYMASRDPKVFKDPNKFYAKRFMGPEGEKLLRHLLWSNGRETEESTVHTKQCAGKNSVVLTGRLFLAELFMRYDSFKVEGRSKSMVFTSLVPASN